MRDLQEKHESRSQQQHALQEQEPTTNRGRERTVSISISFILFLDIGMLARFSELRLMIAFTSIGAGLAEQELSVGYICFDCYFYIYLVWLLYEAELRFLAFTFYYQSTSILRHESPILDCCRSYVFVL